MKLYFITILIAAFGIHNQSKNNYQVDAFEKYVRPSSQFIAVNEDMKPDDFLFSRHLIDFDRYSIFFKNEIAEAQNPSGVNTEVGCLNLNKVGKKRSYRKVHFTNVDEGLFFCEVFNDIKKKDDFESSVIFGVSYIYLFQVDDTGSIKLIKVKKMDNL